MTFVYCGGNTMDNLGNGFLDIGAWYQLSKVCPDAKVISVSNTSPEKAYFYGAKHGFRQPGKSRINRFDLRMQFDADYYVFTAACLCDSWFDINKEFLGWLADGQHKVVILGASGSDSGSLKYNPSEMNRIKDRIASLNLYLMTSRDNDTFDVFADLATHAHNGIDCAMFLNDAFEPSNMNMGSFDVFTFDGCPEQSVETSRQVLRLCHKSSDVDSLSRTIRHPRRVHGLMHKRDWVSDFPKDYLNIYANCDTTYSDRVHACVASLIFGNNAQYFGNSPRSGLLSRVLGDAPFMERPVSLDLDFVEIEKAAQLAFLSEHLIR